MSDAYTDKRSEPAGSWTGKGESGLGPTSYSFEPATGVHTAGTISKIVEERRSVYGPPEVNFRRIADLMRVIDECEDRNARVALYGIAVKVARLIQTPGHADSWDDIAGYADCGKRVTGVNREAKAQGLGGYAPDPVMEEGWKR